MQNVHNEEREREREREREVNLWRLSFHDFTYDYIFVNLSHFEQKMKRIHQKNNSNFTNLFKVKSYSCSIYRHLQREVSVI